MTPAQLKSLLSAVNAVLPGARYAPEESWDGETKVKFDAICDCGEECSTEPCSLLVFLKAPLVGTSANIQNIVTWTVKHWATCNLKWEGCGCCDGRLDIDVRLFGERGGKWGRQQRQ